MQSGTNDGKNGSELTRSAAPKSRARVKKPSSTPATTPGSTPGSTRSKTLSLSAKVPAPASTISPASKVAKSKQKSVAAAAPTRSLDGLIATAAYFLAEQRHFAPGHELEDWLCAETQVRDQSTPAS